MFILSHLILQINQSFEKITTKGHELGSMAL